MKENSNKTKEQLSFELKELRNKSEDREEKLKTVNKQLSERVKELNCFYEISRIVETPDITLKEIFHRVVEAIPAFWQYSKIAVCRIILDGIEYKTHGFRKTKFSQSSRIIVAGKDLGDIEVCYLEEVPEFDEGSFLKEERLLLNALAERLGRIAERKYAEEKLRLTNNQLDASNQQLSASEQQLSASNQQLEANNQQLSATEQQLRASNIELLVSEKKYKVLSENMPIGLVLHDSNTQIIFSNPAAHRLLGLTKEQMVGKKSIDPAWSFCREDGSQLPLSEYPVNKVVESNEPLDEYIVGVKIPGRDFISWVSVNATPVYNNERSLSFVTITFSDITDRKRAEEEKVKLENQLRQSQKMEAVGQLAGGVAHDFNNMLAVILGHAELTLGKISPDQPFHADIMEIKIAAQRSADLTRQLLAFARKQTVTPKVIDMNEAVTGIASMLQRLIGEDIDLLWISGDKQCLVKIDPSQIDQILANLCINARDAIADGGKISIKTSNIVFNESYCSDHAEFVPGEYVVLSVSDDGCGMDTKTQSKLFEPFFTTKEQGKGTGLGLATVYGAVKQNNGFINVYSEPDQGTTFKIYLPQYFVKPDPLLDNKTDAPVIRGHETILLVEDESMILEITTVMLEGEGYTVMAASTPSEAMELVQSFSGEIDLLITDVVMPEMNGLDMARKFLTHYPNIKCLFMSGYTANVIAHHGVLDDGINFIQKPFSIKDLSIKVRAVLNAESEE